MIVIVRRPFSIVLTASVAFVAAGGTCAGAQPSDPSAAPPEVWAFTAFWDERSAESLARNRNALQAVVTTWIALDTITSEPVTLYQDSLAGSEPRRMALLTSWFGERFHPASVRRLAGDPARLARAASFTARALAAGGHAGLVIDFEDHEQADLPALLRVVRTIADTVSARGLGPVTVAVPATDTGGYPGRALIEAGADFVLPMLYDQHWAGGRAGPVAAPEWVAEALGTRVQEVGADHIVAALPLYGYRWPSSGGGRTVTHREALASATDAGVNLERDSATATLRATLPDGDEIWVTDADLLARLFEVVREAGVTRVALWHLGQEDPAAWSVIRATAAEQP